MLNKKGNAYQALWLGVGNFLTFSVSLISAAILSRYFSKSEYGTYKQIIYIYNSFLIIFSAGLPKVISYYLPRFKIEQGKSIINKLNLLLFLFGFIFSCFIFISSDLFALILKNPELSIPLKHFSIVPMFLLPTLGIEGLYTVYKRAKEVAIYNVITRCLMLLLIVLPVIIFNGNIIDAVNGWILVSFLSFIIGLYYKNRPFISIRKEKSNLSYTDILKYSIPIVSASLSGLAIKSSTQFFISRYYGPDVFAEYSNGFIQIPFVNMITAATSAVLFPQFSKIIFNKENVSSIINLWNNTLVKSAIIIYPIVVYFIFHSKEIVILMYSHEYIKSSVYFKIAMIVNFFNIIVVSSLLLSLGGTKFYSKIHFYAAIMSWLFGYLIVLTSNNPIHIAILSVIVSVILVVGCIVKISKLLNVKIEFLVPFKKLALILVHSILTMIVVLFISYFLNIDNKLYVLIGDLILYTGLIFLTATYFKIDYLLVIKSLFKRQS